MPAARQLGMSVPELAGDPNSEWWTAVGMAAHILEVEAQQEAVAASG